MRLWSLIPVQRLIEVDPVSSLGVLSINHMDVRGVEKEVGDSKFPFALFKLQLTKSNKLVETTFLPHQFHHRADEVVRVELFGWLGSHDWQLHAWWQALIRSFTYAGLSNCPSHGRAARAPRRAHPIIRQEEG